MKIIDESEKIDDEKEIKDLLTNYVEKEMSFIHEKDMPGYQHTCSRRYRRKQKKIFWTEKYFGTNLHLGYAVKRVAIVILLIFGLTATSKVSAAIFGFDPWEYFISFLSDSKIVKKGKQLFMGLLHSIMKKKKITAVGFNGMIIYIII